MYFKFSRLSTVSLIKNRTETRTQCNDILPDTVYNIRTFIFIVGHFKIFISYDNIVISDLKSTKLCSFMLFYLNLVKIQQSGQVRSGKKIVHPKIWKKISKISNFRKIRVIYIILFLLNS